MLPVILCHNSNVQVKSHLTNRLKHWAYFSSDWQRVSWFGKSERETTALSKHQQSMVNLHPGWHVWASSRKLIALSVGCVWFGCCSLKRGTISMHLNRCVFKLHEHQNTNMTKYSCSFTLNLYNYCNTSNGTWGVHWFVLVSLNCLSHSYVAPSTSRFGFSVRALAAIPNSLHKKIDTDLTYFAIVLSDLSL